MQLPEPIRKALNERLVRSAFSDYDGLTEWLNEQLQTEGLELRIARSALGRHGKQFADKIEALRVATEQAKAITEAAGDDEGAMSDALVRLVQEKYFNALVNMDFEAADLDPNKLGTMISKLTHASVSQKKWMSEMRGKIDEKTKAAAEKVEGLARKGGLTPETVQAIRREILGVRVD